LNLPFLCISVIYGLLWSVDLIEHGKEEVRKVNAWKSLVGTVCLFMLIHFAILTGY